MKYMKLLERDLKDKNEVEVCRELTHIALELLGYIKIEKVKREGAIITFTDRWGVGSTTEEMVAAVNAMTATMAKAICKIDKIAKVKLKEKDKTFVNWSDEQLENLLKDIMDGKVD